MMRAYDRKARMRRASLFPFEIPRLMWRHRLSWREVERRFHFWVWYGPPVPPGDPK